MGQCRHCESIVADGVETCALCDKSGAFSKQEGDTVIVEEPSGGKKGDGGKPRWDLIDFEFIDEVAKVLTFGAERYGDYNWRKVSRHRYVAAVFRHLKAGLCGEDSDPETGCSHFAHATCCLMFLFWFERSED